MVGDLEWITGWSSMNETKWNVQLALAALVATDYSSSSPLVLVRSIMMAAIISLLVQICENRLLFGTAGTSDIRRQQQGSSFMSMRTIDETCPIA